MIRPRARLLVLLLTAAVASALPRAARAEEAAARAERFDGLIESLNVPSSRRKPVLETIYNELRGPDAREMHDVIRDALSRGNNLILAGVVEAMAMLGDPNDVGYLEALLATSDYHETKIAAIRLLPAFCLSSERARFNFIQYAAGYERTPAKGVLDPLRRPPLTRRGRFDPALEHLRDRVIHCVVGQFDPVAAALRFIDDPALGQAARRTVAHFVGNALGADPGLWARIWAAQGGEMTLNAPGDVEEIRLAALSALADMGAEGLREVIDSFRGLDARGDAVLAQAAFETMTVMCRAAYAEHPVLEAMQSGAEDQVEAENWRLQRYASGARIGAYTAEAAGGALAPDLDGGVFDAAANALGVSLSYPDDYPDRDGGLERAKAAGLARLESLLLMPDLSREKRASVALALGEAGTERSAGALASIIDSPYCSPEFGADGVRLADSAIQALTRTATGGHDGARAARETLLRLLEDDREFPAARQGTPPTGIRHMALWRMQRLAGSNDVSMNPAAWRTRLGW